MNVIRIERNYKTEGGRGRNNDSDIRPNLNKSSSPKFTETLFYRQTKDLRIDKGDIVFEFVRLTNLFSITLDLYTSTINNILDMLVKNEFQYTRVLFFGFSFSRQNSLDSFFLEKQPRISVYAKNVSAEMSP